MTRRNSGTMHGLIYRTNSRELSKLMNNSKSHHLICPACLEHFFDELKYKAHYKAAHTTKKS